MGSVFLEAILPKFKHNERDFNCNELKRKVHKSKENSTKVKGILNLAVRRIKLLK